MSDAVPSIEGYSMNQIVDKTLYAKTNMYVYGSAANGTPPTYGVKAGDPIGVVYSWLDANPTYGRTGIWFMFYPSGGQSNYYYAPYVQGWYDVSELQVQGALTDLQVIQAEKDKEKEDNTTWYEKLGDKLVPVIIWVSLGVAAIKILPDILRRERKPAPQKAITGRKRSKKR